MRQPLDSSSVPERAPTPTPSGFRRIAVLFNPRSGRGRGAVTADAFAAALTGAGHEVAGASVDDPGCDLRSGYDVLVLGGGDGTVNHSIARCVEAGVPLYQIPMGTENLFARGFGMTRDPAVLLRSIERWRVDEIDVASIATAGAAAGRQFLLMCSVGPDAGVVHRLAGARSGAISHLSYAAPIARELLRPSLPALTVEVDGEKLVDGRAGMLVVANSREYGVRLNPASRALMSDGLLDVVFFPASASISLVRWLMVARLGLHTRSSKLLYRTGRAVRIESAGRTAPFQLDGEMGGRIGAADEGALVTLREGAMRVLRPAGA